MRELPHTLSCFVCGESNPAGLRLRFRTDGQAAYADWTPEAHHIGFQGVVHGGIISTILDEIMVWGCAVQTRKFAYCAELSVRFLQAVRVGEPMTAVGTLAVNRRNRIYEATSRLLDPRGQVVATGQGKYFPIRDEDLAKLLTDVVGSLDEVLAPSSESNPLT